MALKKLKRFKIERIGSLECASTFEITRGTNSRAVMAINIERRQKITTVQMLLDVTWKKPIFHSTRNQSDLSASQPTNINTKSHKLQVVVSLHSQTCFYAARVHLLFHTGRANNFQFPLLTLPRHLQAHVHHKTAPKNSLRPRNILAIHFALVCFSATSS